MALLNRQIQLRVTEEERVRIQADATQRGMSVNNYLRSIVLGFPLEEHLELADRLTTLEARVAALE